MFTVNVSVEELRAWLAKDLAEHPLPPGMVPTGYHPVVHTQWHEDGSVIISLVLERAETHMEQSA